MKRVMKKDLTKFIFLIGIIFIFALIIRMPFLSSDAPNPDVIINSPLNQTYNSSSVLFNITATDDATLDLCWYSLNDGTTNQSLTNQVGTNYYTYVNSSMVDNDYNVKFWCNDTDGNLNDTGIVTFTVLNFFETRSTGTLRHLKVSNANLILYLPFDASHNSENKTYDYSNELNNGTLVNSPMWVSSGYIGGAYNFSGSNYILVNDSNGMFDFGPTPEIKNFSLSVWINLDSNTNLDWIGATISAGIFHNCVLLKNNKVLCWGAGSNSQIGDNTSIGKHIPTPVYGNYDFKSISAGFGHNCGLLINGSAMCWGGNNPYGGLGDNTTTDRNVPIPVYGNYNFSQIYSGFWYTCGLLQNGSALCWGNSSYGNLGDNTTTQRLVPTPVFGNYSFKSISAGNYHTCGLLQNGSALCWGWNQYGQIGNGSIGDSKIPLFVSGNYNFSSIYAGYLHTCGLLQNGSALCWGRNSDGFLGDNTTTQRLVPTPVFGNYNFSQLSLKSSHTAAAYICTCGLLQNGSAMCWGSNNYGQLGDNTTVGKYIPTPVFGNYSFSSISSGSWHTCGVLTNGTIMCWGYDYYGQLGDGTTGETDSNYKLIPTIALKGILFGKQINHEIGTIFDSYTLTLDFNNTFYEFINDQKISSNTSLNSGWNNIILSFNSPTQSSYLYFNNNLVNTTEITGLSSDGVLPLVAMQNIPGLIDEVMIYNKYLNPTEVSDLYNNQSIRFSPSADVNTSVTLGNRLNIVLDNCSTLMGTIIQASIEGTWRNFSGCSLNNLETTAGTKNISIRLLSDAYRFYTPNILGNITFTSWTYTAPAPAESPTGGSSGAPRSSNPIYVPSALKESFWTQTTVVMESNWEEVAQPVLTEDTQQPITEEQAITLEQELLNELNTNPDAEIQEIAVKEFSENLSVTERLKITEKNTTAYIGVASISGDSAVVQVSSGGGGGGTTQSIMKLGETKSFDLNGDGLNDIRITLMKIDPKLRIGIKIAVIYNGLLPAKEIPEYEQEQKSNKLLILALVVVGFLIVVTVFLRFRKFK